MTRKRRSQPYQIKGVDALFGAADVDDLPQQSLQQESLNKEDVNSIALHLISLPERQPRRYFDPVKLEQLTESVKQHGILEPILVRPLQDDLYELVAGERRYRAATEAGFESIPAVVREFNDLEALEVSLLENLQREDLNPVEETEGILDLLSITLNTTRAEIISLLNQVANARKRNQDLTDNVIRQMERVEQVFKLLGRSSPESFRTNRLPLLNLPGDILEALQQGEIEYTKARAIGKVKNKSEREKLLDNAVQNNLSLSEIRTQIRQTSKSSDRRLRLESRFSKIGRKIKQVNLLDDDLKTQRFEQLLEQLEGLLNE